MKRFFKLGLLFSIGIYITLFKRANSGIADFKADKF